MRRLAALGLFVLTFAGCAAPAPEHVTCATGVAFENTDHAYGLCLPAGDWTAQCHVYGVEVQVQAPARPSDPFQANVNVVHERVPANLTLVQQAAALLQQASRYATNVTLFVRTNTTLGGEPALALAYAGVVHYSRNVTLPLYWEQTVALHGGLAYMVTYTSFYGNQGIFQSAVDSMLASWRFLTPGPLPSAPGIRTC
ncbi:MAG: hypothetical protein ACYDBQ_10000 [Thermoplasmatota archaeon]